MPDDTPFRTKPVLLRLMIARTVAAGIPFRWVAAPRMTQTPTSARLGVAAADQMTDAHIRLLAALTVAERTSTG